MSFIAKLNIRSTEFMAKISIELSLKITVFRVQGKLPSEELITMVKETYPFIVTPDVLWDLSEAVLVGVSASTFQKIPPIVKEFSSSRRNGRTAIVITNDVIYWKFRQYTIYAEMNELPYQYGVYRNFDDAMEWLCADDGRQWWTGF